MEASSLEEATKQADIYADSSTNIVGELDAELKEELAKLIKDSYIQGWIGGSNHSRKADSGSNNKVSVPSTKPGLAVLLSDLERT